MEHSPRWKPCRLSFMREPMIGRLLWCTQTVASVPRWWSGSGHRSRRCLMVQLPPSTRPHYSRQNGPAAVAASALSCLGDERVAFVTLGAPSDRGGVFHQRRDRARRIYRPKTVIITIRIIIFRYRLRSRYVMYARSINRWQKLRTIVVVEHCVIDK